MRYAADLAALLLYYAPETADLSSEVIEMALAEAIPFRPRGIPDAKADKAQCLYAAWQLSLSRGAAGDGSGASPSLGSAVRLKEGDVQVDFAEQGERVASLAASGNYKARYDAFMRLSGRCSIITRFGRSTDIPKARISTTCIGACVLWE